MGGFGLRFDLRNPAIAGTTMAERMAAGLDMMEWADGLGASSILFSEHHGSDDGYLPDALSMAAAAAARTTRARIVVAAVVAALHDPVRLAERAAVVDNISGGRLDLVVVNGYVASEFAMQGCPLQERLGRVLETVDVLRKAWTGEPFEFHGRRIVVTPRPVQPGGPPIILGASVPAAARRAARIADGMLPSDPSLWEDYRSELARLGKPDPGPYRGDDTSVIHLATTKQAGWKTLAPFALHEVNAYGRWFTEAGLGAAGGYVPVSDEAALAETGQYRVLTPAELLAEVRARGEGAFVTFHPMVGGLPPGPAWESLRLFEREVLAHL